MTFHNIKDAQRIRSMRSIFACSDTQTRLLLRYRFREIAPQIDIHTTLVKKYQDRTHTKIYATHEHICKRLNIHKLLIVRVNNSYAVCTNKFTNTNKFYGSHKDFYYYLEAMLCGCCQFQLKLFALFFLPNQYYYQAWT